MINAGRVSTCTGQVAVFRGKSKYIRVKYIFVRGISCFMRVKMWFIRGVSRFVRGVCEFVLLRDPKRG